jgi:hypothetical protein
MRRLGESSGPGRDFSFELATIRSGSAGRVAGTATDQKPLLAVGRSVGCVQRVAHELDLSALVLDPARSGDHGAEALSDACRRLIAGLTVDLDRCEV